MRDFATARPGPHCTLPALRGRRSGFHWNVWAHCEYSSVGAFKALQASTAGQRFKFWLIACAQIFKVGGRARSRNSSVLVFFWARLGTTRRSVITVVHSDSECQPGCGCHGRCTTSAILNIISWSFRVWQTGRLPVRRIQRGPIRKDRSQSPLPPPTLLCQPDAPAKYRPAGSGKRARERRARPFDLLLGPCCGRKGAPP